MSPFLHYKLARGVVVCCVSALAMVAADQPDHAALTGALAAAVLGAAREMEDLLNPDYPEDDSNSPLEGFVFTAFGGFLASILVALMTFSP